MGRNSGVFLLLRRSQKRYIALLENPRVHMQFPTEYFSYNLYYVK